MTEFVGNIFDNVAYYLIIFFGVGLCLYGVFVFAISVWQVLWVFINPSDRRKHLPLSFAQIVNGLFDLLVGGLLIFYATSTEIISFWVLLPFVGYLLVEMFVRRVYVKKLTPEL